MTKIIKAENYELIIKALWKAIMPRSKLKMSVFFKKKNGIFLIYTKFLLE